MVYVLGTSDKNTLLATRIFHERFPKRKVPMRESFELWMQLFDTTENVAYEKLERIKSVPLKRTSSQFFRS